MSNATSFDYAVIRNYYNIYGNTPLPEADIICVPENHMSACQSLNALLVNIIFKNINWKSLSGDPLILVENTPYKETIDLVKHPMTCSIQHSSLKTAQGWDLPGIRERINELNQHNATIKCSVATLQKALTTNDFTPFFAPNGPFKNLMSYAPKNMQQKEAAIFDPLKQGNMRGFLDKINELIDAVNGEHKKKIHILTRTTFQARQKYLQLSIDEGLSAQKKVMAFMGATHVIQNPNFPEKEFSITSISEYLKTKKFVIVLLKASDLAIENMPALWTVNLVALRVLQNSPPPSKEKTQDNSPLPPIEQLSLTSSTNSVSKKEEERKED